MIIIPIIAIAHNCYQGTSALASLYARPHSTIYPVAGHVIKIMHLVLGAGTSRLGSSDRGSGFSGLGS